MKKILVPALFCFLILIFFTSSAPGQKATGPKMVMPETSHDFKEVEEGTVLEHSFQVMNQGSQVLEIKNVNPG